VAPARGLNYDRKGRLLADNVASGLPDAVPAGTRGGQRPPAKPR